MINTSECPDASEIVNAGPIFAIEQSILSSHMLCKTTLNLGAMTNE
jgi:hypothetical protein